MGPDERQGRLRTLRDLDDEPRLEADPQYISAPAIDRSPRGPRHGPDLDLVWSKAHATRGGDPDEEAHHAVDRRLVEALVGVPTRSTRTFSDAERDAVVDRLKREFVEERLTLDQWRERISRALESRTVGDLSAARLDLPEPQALPDAVDSGRTSTVRRGRQLRP